MSQMTVSVDQNFDALWSKFVTAVHLMWSSDPDSTHKLKQMYDDAVADGKNKRGKDGLKLEPATGPVDKPKSSSALASGGTFTSSAASNMAASAGNSGTSGASSREGGNATVLKRGQVKTEKPSESAEQTDRGGGGKSKRPRFTEIDIFASPQDSPSPAAPTTTSSASGGVGSVAQKMVKKEEEEFKMELDSLACALCKQWQQTNSNSLVECQDCHVLYHQKCHKPAITDQQLNDARLIWYCAKCQRSMRKLAAAAATTTSAATAPTNTAPIKAKPSMAPHATSKASSASAGVSASSIAVPATSETLWTKVKPKSSLKSSQSAASLEEKSGSGGGGSGSSKGGCDAGGTGSKTSLTGLAAMAATVLPAPKDPAKLSTIKKSSSASSLSSLSQSRADTQNKKASLNLHQAAEKKLAEMKKKAAKVFQEKQKPLPF